MPHSNHEAASAPHTKLTSVLRGTGNSACARQLIPSVSAPPAYTAPGFETLSLSVTIYRFVSEHKQARRYFVSGSVQGVGFRYFTLRAAERLQVTGYARNLPDGRVEAYAIGTPDQLTKLRSILERGPWGATVSEVREEQAAIDSKYDDGFVINY
jgi:acylphosphatase